MNFVIRLALPWKVQDSFQKLTFILMLTGSIAVQGPVYGNSYSWVDCSTPLYAFPYGFSDSEQIKALLTDDILQKEMDALVWAKELAFKNLPEKPNLDLNPEQVDKQTMEKLLLDSQNYIEAVKKYNNMRLYRDIEEARFYIVFDIFLKSGEEVVEELGSDARFMEGTFTSCDIDKVLTEKILARTLDALQKRVKKALK